MMLAKVVGLFGTARVPLLILSLIRFGDVFFGWFWGKKITPCISTTGGKISSPEFITQGTQCYSIQHCFPPAFFLKQNSGPLQSANKSQSGCCLPLRYLDLNLRFPSPSFKDISILQCDE